jgi:hypothetical protein
MVPSLSTIATMTNSTTASSQHSTSPEKFSTFALGGIIIVGFIFIFGLIIGIRYKYLQTAKTVKVLSSRSVELVTLGEKSPGSNRSATASICSSKSAADTTFDEIYGAHDIECGLTQINLQSLSNDFSSFPGYVQPSLSRPNSNSSKVGDNQDQQCSETNSLEASSLSTDLNDEEEEENNPIDDYQLEEGLGIASCSPTTTRKSANGLKRTASACSKGRPPINSLAPSSRSPPLPYYNNNKNNKNDSSQSCNGSGRSSPSESNSQKQLRSCTDSRKDSSNKQLRFLIDDMMHKPPSRDELEDSFTMIEHDGGGDFGMDGGYMSLKTTSTGSEDSVGIWIKMKDEREGIIFPVIDLNSKQIFK